MPSSLSRRAGNGPLAPYCRVCLFRCDTSRVRALPAEGEGKTGPAADAFGVIGGGCRLADARMRAGPPATCDLVVTVPGAAGQQRAGARSCVAGFCPTSRWRVPGAFWRDRRWGSAVTRDYPEMLSDGASPSPRENALEAGGPDTYASTPRRCYAAARAVRRRSQEMAWPSWSTARHGYELSPTSMYVSSRCQRSPTECRPGRLGLPREHPRRCGRSSRCRRRDGVAVAAVPVGHGGVDPHGHAPSAGAARPT